MNTENTDVNNATPPRLISFEGIEGSGKTTQIKLLSAELTKRGYNILCLREPGGTEFGEQLRASILNSKTQIHPLAEAHLFAASRMQLIHEKILPFLDSPENIVILDRFIDSSFAYQGIARKLGIQTVIDIHQHPPLNLMPDITFYLDIPLGTSFKRQETRGHEKDYFEKEKESFYKKLIIGFEECSKRFPTRFKPIDANRAVEAVHSSIMELLPEYLR